MHAEFPHLTFDFTAKVEHLLKHRHLLAELRECGCAFAVSAFESTSDLVLEKLDKGHTRADMVVALAAAEAAERFRASEATANAVRTEALDLATRVTGAPSRDVNYIVPHFVLNFLPIGLAGLFIAAILAAAMSSISSELNSLSTVTVIDFYRRWVRPEASDAHFLFVSKFATAFWGFVACFVATYAATLGSLIEVVNRFGSFFYGSILGIFLLAMVPFARPWAAFVALITGMCTVAAVTFGAPEISFLWHNVIGALTVLLVGILLSGAGGLHVDWRHEHAE
jgi:Na+(H+)/acetate symporter ActP